MSKQLTDMANERLPGKEADRPAKPSAPLRQRLQQSWQGKVGGPGRRPCRLGPQLIAEHLLCSMWQVLSPVITWFVLPS